MSKSKFGGRFEFVAMYCLLWYMWLCEVPFTVSFSRNHLFHELPNCSFVSIPPFRSAPIVPNMNSFISTVCGHSARTVFDCQSPVSTVSPSFGWRFQYRRVKSCIPVSVVTTTGAFSCFVNLTEEPVDTFYDLKLGRLV